MDQYDEHERKSRKLFLTYERYKINICLYQTFNTSTIIMLLLIFMDLPFSQEAIAFVDHQSHGYVNDKPIVHHVHHH
jgi:hypothetical protein